MILKWQTYFSHSYYHYQFDVSSYLQIINGFFLIFLYTDLSFNNIEVIEGLDRLTQLTDLTLFSNRITRIENMDTLKELQVVSFGNNLLKSLDNVRND